MKIGEVTLAWAIFFSGLGVLWMIGAGSGAFAEHGFVYQFQSLIAGAFALVAALVTWFAIHRQIAASNAATDRQISASADEAEAKRRARVTAYRALLTISLSAIYGYSKACMRLLAELSQKAQGQQIPPQTLDFPNPPTEEFQTLKEFVEVADEDKALLVADLLATIQILSVRMNDICQRLPEAGALKLSIDGRFLDAAEVGTRAANLLPYARRTSNEPTSEITAKAMANMAFIGGGIVIDDFPDLAAKLERDYAGGRNLLKRLGS